MKDFSSQPLPLKKLRMFAETVRQRSITKAADKLCVTQPAVSTAIKGLEQLFGVKLFDVIRKQIHFTTAADVLYRQWQQVEVSLENLQLEMESFHNGMVGELRLVMASSGKYFVPQAMHDFLQHYPNVRFSCDIKRRDYINEAMKNNEYDIAILTDPPYSKHLVQHVLRNNPLVFVVNAQHELASKETLCLKELENRPFILRESSALISQMLMNAFAKQEIALHVLFEIDSTEAIKQAVISGLGIALVPRFCVETEVAYGILKILPIKDVTLQNKWVVTCAHHTEKLQLFKHFLKFLQKG